MRPFPSCGEQGLLLVSALRLLIAVAFLVADQPSPAQPCRGCVFSLVHLLLCWSIMDALEWLTLTARKLFFISLVPFELDHYTLWTAFPQLLFASACPFEKLPDLVME